jgi:AcrR family transcriptional regulator
MADEGRSTPVEDELGDVLDSPAGGERINRVFTEELGAEMGAAYADSRTVQERWASMRHPGEGLRERKKRLMRQQISDVATALFIARGFDRVTVAQVAEIVGVSEKTIYNYFPTKESLVFDQVDEGISRLAGALRERPAEESPTRAILRELAEQNRELAELPEQSHRLLPRFAAMVAETPALRAAWLEVQDRLATVVTAELARQAELDPREPEPAIAARAIGGLAGLALQSRLRHVEAGLGGTALVAAIDEDLERAVRLLDTGLWSFNLLSDGARTRKQLREAALSAEQARKQVMEALRQARSAWRELRGDAHEERREQRDRTGRAASQSTATVRSEAKLGHERVKRAAKAQASAAREEAKRAVKSHATAAREEVKRVAKEQAAAIREEAKRAAKEQIAAARAERRQRS